MKRERLILVLTVANVLLLIASVCCLIWTAKNNKIFNSIEKDFSYEEYENGKVILTFKNNKTIVNNVEKNAPITIQRYDNTDRNGRAFHVYNVMCNGQIVGQLSKSSSIALRMDDERINRLQGFFVSDVFYWTYEDSLLADQRNLRVNGYSTDYASKWCEDAKKQGFIFIVSISGYGN